MPTRYGRNNAAPTHGGRVAGNYPVQAKPYGAANTLTTPAVRGYARARLSSRGYVVSPSNLRGRVYQSYGNEHLFDRIWVSPQRIECGFITEAMTYDIVVWNAYLREAKTFLSVSSVNPAGTTLTYPTVPNIMQPGKELTLTLAVALVGPAVQNTYYRLLIGGDLFSIYITGLRVLALWPGPDWSASPEVRYGFETSMFETNRFVEQRRPLRDISYRSATAKFLLMSEQAQQFFVDAAYGHDKIYGVPIYSEMMRATSIPVAGTTIALDASTPTTYLWNLNNHTSYVLIVDHSNFVGEVKQISTIGTSSIVVTNPIVETFNVNTTYLYPVFFGLIRAITFRQETDDIGTVEIEFTEFNNGG